MLDETRRDGSSQVGHVHETKLQKLIPGSHAEKGIIRSQKLREGPS